MKILTAALTATALMVSFANPIWAQGGDDPMPGIDIIIKEDPSLVPAKPMTFDQAQMKQINALKGDDRPIYALKVIAEEIGAGKGFVAAGAKAFDGIWCGPCKMADELAVKFRADDVAFSLTVRFKAGAELSEKVN